MPGPWCRCRVARSEHSASAGRPVLVASQPGQSALLVLGGLVMAWYRCQPGLVGAWCQCRMVPVPGALVKHGAGGGWLSWSVVPVPGGAGARMLGKAWCQC